MTWKIRHLLQKLRPQRRFPPVERRAHDEAAAATANRLKSELLATMSHEIRTPMNAVLGMADLLRLTDLTRKQLGYLQTIQSSGDMLLSLVDNTLDYARLEAGGIELQAQEFDVAELLERVLQIMGYQAYSKGIELIADFALVPPLRVTADIDRLRQILVNLVSNAIRYSDKGEIVVKLTSQARAGDAVTLKFEVSDQGTGIPKEVQERLLTPFASLDVRAQYKQQGSGLGLTICKRLVEIMGGEIGVRSVLGEGTTAWFAIPAESIVHQSTADGSRRGRLHGKRALVVDSNPLTADILCRYLHSWGLDCAVAKAATVALAQLEAEEDKSWGVVVIDKDLVENDGLLLARQIRARRATADLPIVLLTSIARPLEAGEISLVGNIRCVNKPVLPSELRHNLLRATGADAEFAADKIVTEVATELVSPHQLRVLVAEDNSVNSRILLVMLRTLGCFPDLVEDGPAALQALAREAYDLVLMDCQMPGLDGDQVTKELRANPDRYRSQPVVVAVTADNSDKHRRRCLESGMDGFIAKPIRLEKLISGLEQWPLLLGTWRASNADEDAAAAGVEDLRAQLHSQLVDRAGASGAEFVHDYIDLFLTDTASRLEKMRVALAAKNTAELSHESHALKGTCLEFGVVRMGEYCDSLRAASKQGKLEEASRILAMLDNEYARVCPVFEAEKAASH
jgi:CheY-like chemotaxis protein/nitrogen-specific signal transduction histidine kinase